MIPKETEIAIKHNGQINIATGRSRKETQWKNQEMLWSNFLQKLATTTRTRETFAQYKQMTKDQQAAIKDVGGYVGGLLKGGRRKAGQVGWRSLLTLDADYAPEGLWETIEILFGNAAVIYSTHSHSPERPRLRLVVPLARQVTADEYKALSRFIAAEIGIDFFDDSTYEPERLMYWPSTSEDGEFIFDYLDGPWLDPDNVLARHPEWKDASTWPESSRAVRNRERHAEKQGEPTAKPGVVGAFCRAYTITAAIDTFLSDVYEACGVEGRYTFVAGTAAAGLVVYDDKFAFSHHGTDPAGGILCNAFDLVRIHKYGIQDEDVKEGTPINRLPSYKAMSELAIRDSAVKVELSQAKAAEAAEDFKDGPEEVTADKSDNWRTKLVYSDKGGLQQTINNVVLILRHDPKLTKAICYDELTRRQVLRRDVPWRKLKHTTPGWTDSDDAALRHYLERIYGLKGRDTIHDAVDIVTKENAFHPIRDDYLDGLVWDGKERIDTVLIDYLGADDTAYTRAVSRKWLIAAVARIRDPGCKFDHMMILVGSQGIGKSQFFNRLARKPAWFTDSVSKFDNSKESMEQLAGKWIVELGELSALKRYEVEHVKVFLTKQEDSYRPSYGRCQETYQRQCVFGGTTNRDDFLQDATGNRRFWPVEVRDASRMWAEMTPAVVDQIWAEADAVFTLGEDLYLEGAAAAEATETQEQFMEIGGKIGMAEEFLNRKLPVDWDDRSIKQKQDWIKGYDFDGNDNLRGEVERTRISGVELYVECFQGRPEEYKKADAHEMTDIILRLGWQRSKKQIRINEYGKQRYFCRPEQTEQS